MHPKPSLRSSLQGELVDRIAGIVRSGNRSGERLREAALARELGVSRTPVRAALQHLVSEGTLRSEASGGYSVLRVPKLAGEGLDAAAGRDRLHGLLLRDIILNEIDVPVSESALMRRYRAGRGELSRALKRLVREGLAEPLPGRGWMLLKLGIERLVLGYQLRTILEPAVIADPSFDMDREALSRIRVEHEQAQTSIGAMTSWQSLFDLDAAFHEELAAGTGNDLILDVIRRENRLRRLAEYASYRRTERVRTSLVEHIQILDALLAGNATWASALMRQHLMVSLEETQSHFDRDLRALRQNPRLLEHIAARRSRSRDRAKA